jgi:hypothetical protein
MGATFPLDELARARHGGSGHGAWRPRIDHGLPAVGIGRALNFRILVPWMTDRETLRPYYS